MKNNDQIYIFCENVRRLRKNSNLTKTEMAKRLKISLRSLALIENNILPKRLSANILCKIYLEFNVRPSDMFAQKKSKNKR